MQIWQILTTKTKMPLQIHIKLLEYDFKQTSSVFLPFSTFLYFLRTLIWFSGASTSAFHCATFSTPPVQSLVICFLFEIVSYFRKVSLFSFGQNLFEEYFFLFLFVWNWFLHFLFGCALFFRLCLYQRCVSITDWQI